MASISNDRHALLWSPPPTKLCDLPSNITRHYIPTPHGSLELLHASPPSYVSSQQKCIFFQHGGFGHASVWLQYLTYFSLRGYRCYALSLRGHGGSWKPGFFQMVWRFGQDDMAADLGYAFCWVAAFESAKRDGTFDAEDLVLVGHSAGGGLGQRFLGEGLGEVGALVIFAGFPFTGGTGVYWNWFKLDPWFALRYYIRDFWHPRSPLSSTTLVHRAFFSPEYPVEEVKKFEEWMPEYESMRWPLGQMLQFAKVDNVLKRIIGWQNNKASRLLVLAGSQDQLMTLPVMQALALRYHNAIRKMFRPAWEVLKREAESTEVLSVVEGSGHHIQNDLMWEDGAEKILSFIERL